MIVPRRLRAPTADHAVLEEPLLAEVAALLASNRQRLRQAPADILGLPWEDLRRQARRETVAAARAYLGAAGEPVPAAGDTTLLLAGHQPELFHPGVWVKHFALNGLARAHSATPVNLVVDNDVAKATVLHLPALGANPHVAPVSFDRGMADVPYEERRVHDEALFADLLERTRPFIGDWDFDPLLGAFWAEARRQARRTPLLGERLAAARRTFERAWGCHNLEVPVSRVCRTDSFAWFIGHLLSDLPRFHQIYNSCLHDYRRLYGLRSHAHPVPDLAAADGWLEVPLWAWRADQPRRGRLMVRPRADQLELRVGAEPWPALPRGAALVPAWQDLERRGLKVRSRALTNTLYARLFLGELFIHGIGGAKYDELTDEIVRRFYGFEPPGYLVLSATLLLPLPGFQVQPNDCRRLARKRRDLQHNPQRHLVDGAATDEWARALAAEKKEWIARRPEDALGRRQRFRVLKHLTAQLQPYVAGQEQHVQQDLTLCDHQAQANAVLRRRDYAFCLFPENVLQPFCARFL